MRQVHREIQMDIEHDCTTNSLKSVEATDSESSLHVHSLVNKFPITLHRLLLHRLYYTVNDLHCIS